MMYCNKCRLSVENRISRCPLCAEPLQQKDDVFVEEYPRQHSLRRYMLAIKIILFAVVFVVTGLLLLNQLTGFQWLWALAAICCTVYLGISAILAIRSARNIGLLTLIQTMGISLLTFVIDYSFGHYGWSVNYVIPLLLVLSTLLLTVLIILRPIGLRDFVVYQLVIAAMGLLPVVFVLCGWVTVVWPSAACSFCSAMVFVGMFLFASRKTRHEIRKRFHF